MFIACFHDSFGKTLVKYENSFCKCGQNSKDCHEKADKKAKTVWKSTDKKVAKIVKKCSNGKQPYAKIRGVKPGKAVIKASYITGAKKKVFKCKVTVRKKGTGSGNDSGADADSPDNKNSSDCGVSSDSKTSSTPKPSKAKATSTS